MNSKYLKYSIIFALILFAAILVINLLLLTMFGATNMIEGSSKFDNFASGYLGMLPIVIGLGMLFRYSFIYSEKQNSIVSQLPEKEIVKILAPAAAFIGLSLIVDLIVCSIFGVEEYDLFIIYLKYFVICFGLLFIVSSHSRLKLGIIVLFACYAIVNNNGMFDYFSSSAPTVIFTVVALNALALGLATFLHFYWLKQHKMAVMNAIYFTQMLAIIALFFRTAFFETYPYVIDGASFRVGSYSFAYIPLLLLVAGVIIITYIQESKFDIKKIALYSIPALCLIFGSTALDNGGLNNRNCQKIINSVTRTNSENNEDTWLYHSIMNSFNSNNLLVGDAKNFRTYLNSITKSCRANDPTYSMLINKKVDLQALYQAKQTIIGIHESNLLIDLTKFKFTDYVDSFGDVPPMSVLTFKEKERYTLVYFSEKINPEKKTAFLKRIKDDHGKIIEIKTEEQKKLYNEIINSGLLNTLNETENLEYLDWDFELLMVDEKSDLINGSNYLLPTKDDAQKIKSLIEKVGE